MRHPLRYGLDSGTEGSSGGTRKGNSGGVHREELSVDQSVPVMPQTEQRLDVVVGLQRNRVQEEL
jgi:hypothetical protein